MARLIWKHWSTRDRYYDGDSGDLTKFWVEYDNDTKQHHFTMVWPDLEEKRLKYKRTVAQ